MKDKISLAGDLGSGKSTVSNILIEKLGAEYYSTGAIVRSVANSRGMTVAEFNVYMETHPELDHEIDDGIAKLSEVDKLLIIDSRMAWHFTKGTFKVYLTVDLETSAIRIMSANRAGEHSSTLEATVAETKARRDSEKKRYMLQYGVDIKDLENYDLVVDTTAATPDEIAEIIINAFYEWQNDKSYRAAYISTERINLPEDMYPDEDKMADIAENGTDELPCLISADGEFYLVSGLEAMLNQTFDMTPFIKVTLKTGDVPNGKYCRMRNSL